MRPSGGSLERGEECELRTSSQRRPNETKTVVVQVPYAGGVFGVAPFSKRLSERAKANPAYSPLSAHLLYPLDGRQPPPICVPLLRATNPPFA
jgi:hypothetical protein